MREQRKKELAKAIKLVGWMETVSRIKTIEDRTIFNELMDEDTAKTKEINDQRLKQAGVLF